MFPYCFLNLINLRDLLINGCLRSIVVRMAFVKMVSPAYEAHAEPAQSSGGSSSSSSNRQVPAADQPPPATTDRQQQTTNRPNTNSSYRRQTFETAVFAILRASQVSETTSFATSRASKIPNNPAICGASGRQGVRSYAHLQSFKLPSCRKPLFAKLRTSKVPGTSVFA